MSKLYRSIALGWALLALNGQAQAAIRYTIAEFKPLPGYADSAATALNNDGTVVGRSSGNPGFVAARQAGGTSTQIGPNPSYDPLYFSDANGVNSTGQVTGYTTSANGNRAFLYSDGGMTDIGTLGGNYAAAFGINDSGQIVGTSTDDRGTSRAFIYQNGGMSDLGGFAYTLNSDAYAINASGVAVGRAITEFGEVKAVRFANGSVTSLGSLGGSFGSAFAINAAGFIVGESVNANGIERAFLHDGVSMRDLGALGAGSSSARGINAAGDIVGYSNDKAFLYTNNMMVDLNTLVDPALEWQLLRATAINDRGQIVGYGRRYGALTLGFILTPFDDSAVPEPASWALMIAGFGAAGATLRRRRTALRVRFG